MVIRKQNHRFTEKTLDNKSTVKHFTLITTIWNKAWTQCVCISSLFIFVSQRENTKVWPVLNHNQPFWNQVGLSLLSSLRVLNVKCSFMTFMVPGGGTQVILANKDSGHSNHVYMTVVIMKHALLGVGVLSKLFLKHVGTYLAFGYYSYCINYRHYGLILMIENNHNGSNLTRVMEWLPNSKTPKTKCIIHHALKFFLKKIICTRDTI